MQHGAMTIRTCLHAEIPKIDTRIGLFRCKVSAKLYQITHPLSRNSHSFLPAQKITQPIFSLVALFIALKFKSVNKSVSINLVTENLVLRLILFNITSIQHLEHLPWELKHLRWQLPQSRINWISFHRQEYYQNKKFRLN